MAVVAGMKTPKDHAEPTKVERLFCFKKSRIQVHIKQSSKTYIHIVTYITLTVCLIGVL